MPVSRAQKRMLERCILRLQRSNLSSAFLIWQSSIPVLMALRSMTAASITWWKSGCVPMRPALVMSVVPATFDKARRKQLLSTITLSVPRQDFPIVIAA